MRKAEESFKCAQHSGFPTGLPFVTVGKDDVLRNPHMLLTTLPGRFQADCPSAKSC